MNCIDQHRADIYESISHALQSGSISLRTAKAAAWGYFGVDVKARAKRDFLDRLWLAIQPNPTN